MNYPTRLLAPLALAVAFVAACGSPPPPPPPPAPVINQDSIDAAARARAAAAERARADSVARAEAARRAAEERARAEAAERERAAIAAARAAFATVIYFDLDKSDLKPEARTILMAKLPLLRANMNVRIRIAGHTDDRGSDAYNVALGQRRAAAAKRFLVDQGIAADRIDVVSFGEDRPVAMGSGEENWSKNRRDEFEIIVGGENLRLP
ncbi:MAG: OmpA family protein [Gemmatimonadales bacterium]|nr:OmpA family protein [Gemmatimonadota bacterium]MCL4214374.1 OmpA family protein [Gemmatimonadales bacterium]